MTDRKHTARLANLAAAWDRLDEAAQRELVTVAEDLAAFGPHHALHQWLQRLNQPTTPLRDRLRGASLTKGSDR